MSYLIISVASPPNGISLRQQSLEFQGEQSMLKMHVDEGDGTVKKTVIL